MKLFQRMYLCLLGLSLGAGVASGQQEQDTKAQAIVRLAMETELAADANDHTHWQYRDVDKNAEGETVYRVVETWHGAVKKKIVAGGKPLSSEELKQQDAQVQAFIHDPAQIEKQRKDGLQDDRRAASMLRMLPDAFLWKVKQDNGETVTLDFVPNPAFVPPTMESRVFAAMAGELVVNKLQNRIQTIRGKLVSDVKFAWGLLGKLNAGGTFDVERRELAPGIWQITESHVHIGGHALIFKNIGEQDDEVKSEFRPTPPDATLERAADLLKGEPAELAAER
jgi:hypothetical protein